MAEPRAENIPRWSWAAELVLSLDGTPRDLALNRDAPTEFAVTE